MPTTPCQVYNSMLTVVIPFYLVYVAHVGVAQLGAAAAVERALHPVRGPRPNCQPGGSKGHTRAYAPRSAA